MTTALTINTTDNVLAEVENMQRLCAQLMKTRHYAKMEESGIFAIVQKAKSIGMDPLDALNGGMYFVQGKVEMSGQSMLALIRSKGHSVSMDPKSTETKVIMYGKRADNGDTWRVEFSTDDARRQGIYRNQWEKMPKVMCMWRCVSQLSRFLFSDVIKGIYVQGEIADAIPFDAVVDYNSGEIVETSEIKKEEPKKISQEQSLELTTLMSECSAEAQKKFKEFLTGSGFKTINDLPIESFENLKMLAIKRKSEHQESLNTIAYSMEESIATEE
jgi:hypothetical protein